MSARDWPEGVTVVAVEGIDASGKSTLVAALRSHAGLAEAFTAVSVMLEFSSPIGACLRGGLRAMNPLSVAYAFAAERHWLIENCDSTPGGLVIWDRYVDSAHACRTADVRAGRASVELMDAVREIVARMPRPSMVLYVDLDLPVAMDRLARRLGRPLTVAEAGLLAHQRDAYEELWQVRTPPPWRLDGGAYPDTLADGAVDAILAARAVS